MRVVSSTLLTMGDPRPLFQLLYVSLKNINFQQINLKKGPSSIRHWDLNSRPPDFETPPLTTRPGVTPKFKVLLTLKIFQIFLFIIEPWIIKSKKIKK